MRYYSPKLKGNKGAALILTLSVMTLLMIFLIAFVSMSINQNITSDIFKRRTKAFYLAEAGLDHAVNWLRAQPTPPSGNNTNPWGGIQSLGNGTYSVLIVDLGIVGGTGSGIRRYKITSTGTFGNMNRILTNYVQVDNYARYLWFTDQEIYGNNEVWFGNNDQLNGPAATNGHYNIYRNPIFESEASSADDYIRFYNNNPNNHVNLQQTQNPPHDMSDFQQGVNFGVEPTTMPSQAMGLRSAAASTGGISLIGNTTVVLYNNGTMRVTNAKKKWTNKLMNLPSNGAFFVNKDNQNRATLTISGTLSGRLTVGSSSNVVIPGNIVYANDPRVNPASTDALGIISEKNIIIDDAGPSDLEIDACVMAMDTSFMLENWQTADVKGTLTIYGGIIQDERGPVGTFNSQTGQKVSGYSKDYLYDSRLLGAPPPYMPTTGDYITLSWEEN
jgi:hypothetical protein